MMDKDKAKHIDDYTHKELSMLFMYQKQMILEMIEDLQKQINSLKECRENCSHEVNEQIMSLFIEQGKLSCLLDTCTAFYDNHIDKDHNEFLIQQIENLNKTREEIFGE